MSVHGATGLPSPSSTDFFFADPDEELNTLLPERLFGFGTHPDRFVGHLLWATRGCSHFWFQVTNDTESELVSTPLTATPTIQDACISVSTL